MNRYARSLIAHLPLAQREAIALRMIGANFRSGCRAEHDAWLAENRGYANAIRAARRPDGTMIVVESGRDCDGVAYAGQVHRNIPATIAGFRALYDEVADGADGPFTLRPLPADAEVPTYTSRDLTLEAFEDGRPHALHA